jgi:phage tail-like protein
MKQSEIKRLLPAIFQRTARDGNPLSALLAVMEDMHDPAEWVLDNLDVYFHQYRAPDSFIPYLAGWVDLDHLLTRDPSRASGTTSESFPTGTDRLRELIASAAFLAKWRGTAMGLIRFLEIALGMKGFVVDENPPGEDGQPTPFHIRVTVPTQAQPYIALVKHIIEMEKPAYVTYELQVQAA